GALKAQTEYKCPSSIKALLSKLTETSDRQKWALFRLSYQETDITSDLCTACHGAVETECIEHMRRRKRWHLYCFVCGTCNSEIQHVYPQSAYDEATGILYCPGCAKDHAVAAGGFKFVSQLEQYSFLMRVALKRLYGLLKMKNAVENPSAARYRKGESNIKEITGGMVEGLKQIAGLDQPDTTSAASKEAANKEFDAALAKMDKLELRSDSPGVLGSGKSRTEATPPPSNGEVTARGLGGGQQQQPRKERLAGDTLMPGFIPPLSKLALPSDLGNGSSPLGSDLMSAVTKAAVKEAKSDGNVVQLVEANTEPAPPQVLADRRKPRVAHATTVHTMKARMENRGHSGGIEVPPSTSPEAQGIPTGSGHLPILRRAGQINGSPISVNALAAQAASGGTPLGGSSLAPPALPPKPVKQRRQSEENEAAKLIASNEADTATKVKSMLSRPHTMRFVSDLNTAELFCAKHVAVSRLAALLGGQSEFSQADLVALIGTPKKTSASGMWSRLKTNLKKKDG
ncbi:Rho-type GTPase activating protein Rga1, partial [Coemansia sp. RSA 2673]